MTRGSLGARPVLLMIGPLPRRGSPIGGTQVSFADRVRRFEAVCRYELRVVDTSRPRAGRRGLDDLLVFLRVLAAVLLGRRPQAVLFHVSTRALLLAGPWVWLAARLRRTPLAVSVFGGCLDLGWRNATRVTRRLAAATFLRAPLFLVQTRALAERFARFPGVEWHPTTRELRPVSRAGRPCRRFLYLSALQRAKGLAVALAASDALPVDCSLSVHGPTVDADAWDAGRHPRARRCGAVDPFDVPAVLAEHDALVLPTSWRSEGLPGVVIEALQSGMPVIATRWRSLPEVVRDGENGLLVEPRSVDELACAMRRLAADDGLFRSLCQGARRSGETYLASRWHERLEQRLAALAGPPPPVAWVGRLDRWLYPLVRGHWDDELLRAAVLGVLRPAQRVLDLGAGAGIVAAMDFRGHAAEVCGLDLDPRVLANPLLDRARLGRAESIPWPARSFDLVLADNLLEHLERPAAVLGEVQRVLKPGGLFLAKTPNRRHYVAFLARLTPLGLHRRLNRRRGRDESDTFPTHYRANTPARIAELARGAGLEVARVELHESRPEYLRWNVLTYLVGWLWERVVNRWAALARWRAVMLVELRKPAQPVPEPSERGVGAPAGGPGPAPALRSACRAGVESSGGA